MAKLLESYNMLKVQAINKYQSSGRENLDINALKEMYANCINSPRVLSQITNLDSLIQILEKRGVLSPKNIDALEFIYSTLQLNPACISNHWKLINIERDYNDNYGTEVGTSNVLYSDIFDHRSRPNQEATNERNYSYQGFPSGTGAGEGAPVTSNVSYADRSDHPNHPNQQIRNETNYRSQNFLSERVVKMVSSQIGLSWKSLARYLKVVPEASIDRIEQDPRITSYEERARLILDEYQRNICPSDIKLRLLKALRLLKRMDIHDEVEKVFMWEA